MTRRTASTRRRRDPDPGTGKGATGSRGRPRVVVVGGGFAGLSTVRELGGADVDVLLLDRDLNSTFQPLLYQVATGGLNPGDVTYALRAFAARFPNGQFRRMAVSGVNAERRCVRTDTGEEIGYDYLVLCCGVTANYFGIPGAQEHARTVYTRKAAIEVRDRMLGNLEAYAQGRPEAVEPVVVIVGAGATGVEMAGTLAELRNTALPVTYPELDLVYKGKGTMATIGRSAAVVQLPRGVKLKGRLATVANLSVRYLAWPGRLNVIVGDPP
jgi:NADH dehydrogenase